MKTSRLITIFLLLFSTLSACTQETDSPVDRLIIDSTMTSTTGITPSPSDVSSDLKNTETAMPDAMQVMISKAISHLSNRLGIPEDSIEVARAEAVVWSNASLGCPQPGMAYADILTPGYLILLEANNVDYEYHASKGTEIIYCENPTPPVQGTPMDL
jgi:hypothetical protein